MVVPYWIFIVWGFLTRDSLFGFHYSRPLAWGFLIGDSVWGDSLFFGGNPCWGFVGGASVLGILLRGSFLGVHYWGFQVRDSLLAISYRGSLIVVPS